MRLWKNLSVDQKDQRRRSVLVGHADFPKSPKENKTSLNMSVACLLRKIDAQEAHDHFITVYKSVLTVFIPEFSRVVWLRVRPENEPQKIGQCRYFWVFRTDQKKKSL